MGRKFQGVQLVRVHNCIIGGAFGILDKRSVEVFQAVEAQEKAAGQLQGGGCKLYDEGTPD